MIIAHDMSPSYGFSLPGFSPPFLHDRGLSANRVNELTSHPSSGQEATPMLTVTFPSGRAPRPLITGDFLAFLEGACDEGAKRFFEGIVRLLHKTVKDCYRAGNAFSFYYIARPGVYAGHS
jgi:hypothetical protein